jgi:hypothetical protein
MCAPLGLERGLVLLTLCKLSVWDSKSSQYDFMSNLDPWSEGLLSSTVLFS